MVRLYTHRVAIANSRLIAFDKNTVSFKYKDYRFEAVSSLGGFRTPAAGVRGIAVCGRHPKPFTGTDISRRGGHCGYSSRTATAPTRTNPARPFSLID